MSDEQESLSSIASFGTKAQPAAPEAKGEAAKPAEAAPPAAREEASADKAEKPTQSRDESGRFSKAEEKPADKPQEKPRADVAAIIDERRKRQDAEKRLQELLSKQEKPAAKPSVFENEDAAISSRVDEGTRSIRETIYKLSVKTARSLYKDFGEAETAFMEAMQKDERLLDGLRASDDPGEYIYTMGIHVRELADVGGDLMKYRDKVTSGEKARADDLEKQLAAMRSELETLKKAQTELESVPRSLNSTSSGPAPKSGEADDDDIRTIARFNQRR